MGKKARKSRWQNVETLNELTHPNQVAIELLKRAEAKEIASVAVVVRTTNGCLETLWSECDMPELSEKAMYLHGVVTEILLDVHEDLPLSEGTEECDDDC